MHHDLGTLSSPNAHFEPLEMQNTSNATALEMLNSMVLIREVEEQIAEMLDAGEVKCPCHFAIGQEAVAVGVATSLRPTDRGFGAHRSHSHYLASGGNVDKLMAEVLGKADGASKGMGGSMHLYSADTGFAGSVPIVAGTVPLAVGAALAAKMDGAGDIGIAYFGDGACEEGVVHEAMNLASTMKLPVLFVVENNLYSSHLDISLRQPSDRVGRFAESHMIETHLVDGNDVIEVARVAKKLIEQARAGEGPGFIEAITYRWRGHVGSDENIDVGLRRSEEELAAWKKRDPIARLSKALVNRGVSGSEIEDSAGDIKTLVSKARTKAYQSPFPNEEALLSCVYAEGE